MATRKRKSKMPCQVCGKKIKVMAQIGTGYCCRNCEKKAGSSSEG